MFLLAERAVGGAPRYTAREVAERPSCRSSA
jgi:hypothetical protein